jgi:hypothetical protein
MAYTVYTRSLKWKKLCAEVKKRARVRLKRSNLLGRGRRLAGRQSIRSCCGTSSVDSAASSSRSKA